MRRLDIIAFPVFVEMNILSSSTSINFSIFTIQYNLTSSTDLGPCLSSPRLNCAGYDLVHYSDVYVKNT